MLKAILWIACIVVTALLVLDVAYCWHGSLEMFPTEEQQDKVFTVTMMIGIALVLIDGVLLWRLTRR